jgi:uncharacterized protein (TIGR02466 family)
MSEIFKIFPTIVHISKYENDITEELKFVKNIEYKSNGDINSNGNYLSTNVYILKEKELKDISVFIQKQLDFYVKEIMFSDDKLIPTISWCNKNPQGSRHHEHRHPNSIISGVFYFAPTKPAPIKLFKSDMSGFEFNIKKWNSVNSTVFIPLMNAGELILFPSSLKHSVAINQDSEERISLSFNTFSTSLGSVESLTYLNSGDLK